MLPCLFTRDLLRPLKEGMYFSPTPCIVRLDHVTYLGQWNVGQSRSKKYGAFTGSLQFSCFFPSTVRIAGPKLGSA